MVFILFSCSNVKQTTKCNIDRDVKLNALANNYEIKKKSNGKVVYIDTASLIIHSELKTISWKYQRNSNLNESRGYTLSQNQIAIQMPINNVNLGNEYLMVAPEPLHDFGASKGYSFEVESKYFIGNHSVKNKAIEQEIHYVKDSQFAINNNLHKCSVYKGYDKNRTYITNYIWVNENGFVNIEYLNLKTKENIIFRKIN